MERPILMNDKGIQAILKRRKTQTRRPIPPVLDTPRYVFKYGDFPHYWRRKSGEWDNFGTMTELIAKHSPYGQRGDRLWVRERWQLCSYSIRPSGTEYRIRYLATDTCAWKKCDRDLSVLDSRGFKPSIFMPREFSRITLEIIDIWIEYLQSITEDNAAAEGIERREGLYIQDFADLWNSIYADRGFPWSSNPQVWCVEFEQIGNME